MESMVQITSVEFESLLKTKFDFEMVKDVLINTASTDWLGESLMWSGETTNAALRYIMGDAYDKKLAELKENGAEE